MEPGTRVIQRQAYRSYQQDGLLDITIGLGILGFVVMILVGEVACLALTWAALFLYLPVKYRVILPRLANGNPVGVPLPAVRRARRVAISLLCGVILLESLVLFASEFYLPAKTWLSGHLWLLLGSLLAVTLAAVGVATGVRRLALYGGLAVLLALFQHFLGWPVYLSFLAVGLVCVFTGSILLVKFLRNNPLRSLSSSP